MIKIYNFILKILIICILTHNAYSQQDPVFSQFFASSIYLNPALSGLEHRFTINGLYRTQWLGTNNQYNSSLLNIIIPYHDKGEKNYHKGGIGASVINSMDSKGSFSKLAASINAAYNVHIAATTAQNLTFGLQIGFVQTQFLNGNNYQWGSSYNDITGNYDPTQAGDVSFTGGTTKVYPDIGAGLIYYYNAGRDIYAPGISAYFGIAASHLNSPNESLLNGKTSKVPTLWKAHGGFEIHLAKKLNFSPNFLVLLQGPSSFLITGATFTYLFADQDKFIKPTRLAFGSAVRVGDAVFAQLGMGSKYYNLGLSYDLSLFGIGKSSAKTVSAFEISLKTSFNIGSKNKKSSKFHTPLM